jgi:peptide/nickel transport system permease protein
MVNSVKARYGLDKPILQQYAMWLGRAVQGDLGQSISTGRPVSQEIGGAIGNSLLLAVLASTLGFSIGGLMGVVAGYLHGSTTDRILSAIAISGVSVPHYWLGMVLVAIFAVQLNLLPAMGAGTGGSTLWDADRLPYLVLPSITLAAIPAGIVMRSVRALVADTLKQEFILGLVAKGMGPAQVFRHLLKNIAPTALAVVGVQLGYLMAGSILVETVFTWPGTGLLLNTAILQRDIPLLQGTILVLAMIFVVLNLLVDLLQPLLDPRMVRS